MPLKSMEKAMHEYKEGTLHSGKGGPVVTNRKQAIAIGLNADRRWAKKPKIGAQRKGIAAAKP